MDLLMIIFLLLACLLISNIITHYLPSIPTSLIQIAIGIIIALLFRNISLEIESDWFLLLFVAPLLYNDGRHFPREDLWKMRASIFGNAIILVLLTTVVGGYFIHWLIPGIPLAAAFALAAILSPTDPVAVNGIAKRIHIPENVLTLVRGESLINDASGLVAFNYAVAAVVTGYFSLPDAVLNFAYLFVAGGLTGVILGLLVTWIRFTLRKQGIHDVTFHSFLHILTPFIIYVVTEELLHASGVIAVVAAGIVHALIKERIGTVAAEEQVLTENIWSIVLFVLNGIVFLLLGLNIPSSMRETVADPNIGNGLVIGYVLAIGAAILIIRFVWSHVFSYNEYRRDKTGTVKPPRFITSLLISLTGVRGAVTMAGVLSIPFLVSGGGAFPERSLILFIAAGVILFTLIAATVFLPLLSKEKPAEGEASMEADIGEAKKKILIAAIKKINSEKNEDNHAVAYELIDEYRMLFRNLQLDLEPDFIVPYQQKRREARLLALKAERQFIHELMDREGIEEAVFETFEKSLDLREEALSQNVRSGVLYIIGRVERGWKRFMGRYYQHDAKKLVRSSLGRYIQLKAMQAAVERLEEYAKHTDKPEAVNAVISEYRRAMDRLKNPAAFYNSKNEEMKEELRIKVMDTERSVIHGMYEAGDISREQARELRRFVNYIENASLYEHAE